MSCDSEEWFKLKCNELDGKYSALAKRIHKLELKMDAFMDSIDALSRKNTIIDNR